VVSDNDRYGANGSGNREGDNLRQLKPGFALVLGSACIFGACLLYSYSLKRGDYFILIGLFCGFIPFLIGATLIFCCFLASPPPIFGFTVGHIAIPWLG